MTALKLIVPKAVGHYLIEKVKDIIKKFSPLEQDKCYIFCFKTSKEGSLYAHIDKEYWDRKIIYCAELKKAGKHIENVDDVIDEFVIYLRDALEKFLNAKITYKPNLFVEQKEDGIYLLKIRGGVETYEKIFTCIFVDLEIIHDIISKQYKYVARVKDVKRGREFIIEFQEIETLFEELDRRNLILDANKAKNMLRIIINHFGQKAKDNISYFGFLLIKEKGNNMRILFNKYNVEKVEEEQLKGSLLLLNKIIDEYYSYDENYKKCAVTTLKWILYAPFLASLKILYNNSDRICDLCPYLYIVGPSEVGKSSMLKLFLRIWLDKEDLGNLNSRFIETSPDGIKTAPRLYNQLQQTNFPLIVNEFSLDKVSNKQEIIDNLKASINQLTPKVYGYVDVQKAQYAFRNIAFTSNKLAYFDDSGLARRLYIMQLSVDTKLPREKLEDFWRFEQSEELDKLKIIGSAIIDEVLQDPSLLELDFLEFGRKMLEKLYNKAGLEVPEWVGLVFERMYRKEELIDLAVSDVLKEITVNLYKDVSHLKDLEEILKYATGVIFKPESNKIVLTSAFVKKYAPDVSLKDLYNILREKTEKVEHKNIRVKDKVVKGIIIDKEEFINILTTKVGEANLLLAMDESEESIINSIIQYLEDVLSGNEKHLVMKFYKEYTTDNVYQFLKLLEEEGILIEEDNSDEPWNYIFSINLDMLMKKYQKIYEIKDKMMELM